MAAMLEFRTQGYNPYAVKYSPYYDSRIAVAASANFGIVGNGRVFALGLTAQGVQVEKTYVRGIPPSLKDTLCAGADTIMSTWTSDSIPMMRSTTLPGPRSTRTSS